MAATARQIALEPLPPTEIEPPQPLRPSTARPPRRHRKWLAGSLSLLVVALVFGFAFPRMASYGQEWHAVTSMTAGEMLLVAVAAAASQIASWFAVSALLPRVRLRQAAAVNLSSTAVANTLPAGGAVAVGVSWAMLSSWGIGAPEFVRYTLVSGLWNVFARLGLPVIALLVLAISGQSGAVPPAAAYCGAGALLVAMAGFRALLRSQRLAQFAGRAAQRAVTFAGRLTGRQPTHRLPGAMLDFRTGTSTLLTERGMRITVTTLIAQLSSWLVLLACLRASGLSQGQVSWQASLAAFALVRLLSVLPLTPGGLGIVELGLTGPLVAGLGAAAAARVAAAVLLFRAVTYLLPIPLGGLAYLCWRRTRPPPGLRVDDRLGDRRRHGAEDIELLVQAGAAKRRGHRRRGPGQSQHATKQPDAPGRANQHGKAAGVAVLDVGQIDDEPAGIRPQDAEELFTQHRSAGNIKIAGERRNGAAILEAR